MHQGAAHHLAFSHWMRCTGLICSTRALQMCRSLPHVWCTEGFLALEKTEGEVAACMLRSDIRVS